MEPGAVEWRKLESLGGWRKGGGGCRRGFPLSLSLSLHPVYIHSQDSTSMDTGTTTTTTTTSTPPLSSSSSTSTSAESTPELFNLPNSRESTSSPAS